MTQETLTALIPRGTEVDRLDYWYNRCDELYWMAAANQLSRTKYTELAEELDREGVGEHYSPTRSSGAASSSAGLWLQELSRLRPHVPGRYKPSLKFIPKHFTTVLCRKVDVHEAKRFVNAHVVHFEERFLS